MFMSKQMTLSPWEQSPRLIGCICLTGQEGVKRKGSGGLPLWFEFMQVSNPTECHDKGLTEIPVNIDLKFCCVGTPQSCLIRN